MGLTLQQASDELRDLHGLDLEETESFRLLNEGYAELCVRSEWTRATLEIGTTVADQTNYAFPSTPTIYRPLKLRVDGQPYTPADEELVDEIVAGTMRLLARGLYWLDHDADGVENFAIYPTPSEADLVIDALCVVFPDTLEAGDEFGVPGDFARAPIEYTRAVSIGSSEDDPEAQVQGFSAFDAYVTRLRALRRARVGHGPVTMRIRGVTA